MRYVPFDALAETPNVAVDGPPAPSTVLVLSHWPGNRTPAPLKDDLSAQIVFRYLDRPDLHAASGVVSNNHFDEDGLVSLYAMIEPEAARARRGFWIDVAAAGDFGTCRARDAARAAFTLSAFSDPERSPLGAAFFAQPYATVTAGLYEHLLPRLPEIAGDVPRWKPLWEEEAARLTDAEEALRSGRIRIEEVPDLDLAVVVVPEDFAGEPHPMAVHNATQLLRVLLMRGRRYELRYRYESWVELISRRPQPRIDLARLAEAFGAEEGPDARWEFDGVDAITPSLHLVGAPQSAIPPERFRRRVEAYLREQADPERQRGSSG
jgi:hypothetical protein